MEIKTCHKASTSFRIGVEGLGLSLRVLDWSGALDVRGATSKLDGGCSTSQLRTERLGNRGHRGDHQHHPLQYSITIQMLIPNLL